MSQYNNATEAGPRNRPWWLEPNEVEEVRTEQAQTSTAAYPQQHYHTRPETNDNEVMGFEEITSPSQSGPFTEHTPQTDTTADDEGEEDHDLILTRHGLTRINSFDFVAGQAQENESKAAMADMINRSVNHESTPLETPIPAVTNDQNSTQRYGGRYTEDIEMVVQSKNRRALDLEAARGECGRKKGGWMQSLSLW